MNKTAEIKTCHCNNPDKQGQKITESVSKIKKGSKALPSVVLSIFIAFFPKCPFCWAAYMSMFGSIGLARLPYIKWLLPVLLLLLGVHLLILLKRSSRQGYLPFILSMAGAITKH